MARHLRGKQQVFHEALGGSNSSGKVVDPTLTLFSLTNLCGSYAEAASHMSLLQPNKSTVPKESEAKDKTFLHLFVAVWMLTESADPDKSAFPP